MAIDFRYKFIGDQKLEDLRAKGTVVILDLRDPVIVRDKPISGARVCSGRNVLAAFSGLDKKTPIVINGVDTDDSLIGIAHSAATTQGFGKVFVYKNSPTTKTR